MSISNTHSHPLNTGYAKKKKQKQKQLYNFVLSTYRESNNIKYCVLKEKYALTFSVSLDSTKGT